MRLSIVIPAHNEEQRIVPMLESYLPFFAARYGESVEFLVVINGSTDRTEEVVAGFAARFPCLRLLVEPEPVGKGGALMMGFREACGELVGFVDADGATPPEAFQHLVDKIGDDGAIIASRWAKGSQVSPRQPLDRRIASRLFNLMTRILFGLRLTDTQCGAKLMRREAIAAILPHLGITRWAFDVDLLFQLRRGGFRIREVPTVWHDVEGSKIQVGKASTEMMMALARLRLVYSPFRWIVDLYGKFGPWIHPVGEVRDHLFTHSLILFLGSQFGNVCNLLFQVLMARMMSDSDYGVLFAVLSAMIMLSMPLNALGGAVTHFTALFMAREDRQGIRSMITALGRDLLVPAGLVVLAVALAGRPLSAAFKLGSTAPVGLAAATLITMALMTVLNGVLSGMQAFEWVAVLGNAWPVLRLILGVVFIALGWGALGGLSANLTGLLLATGLALLICLSLLGRRGWGVRRPAGLYSYTGRYMLTALAFGVLSSADVLMVKYYFPADQAGVFAKAAMLARMAFFLPGPVCSAMFPKVTSEGDSSPANRRTLKKAMVMTGVLGGGIGVVCALFPSLLLKVLVRDVQPGQGEVLRAMALAMMPLTLVMVLMYYEVAQRRFRIMIPLYICAAAYVMGVMHWHGSLLQVVGVLATASVAALGLSWLFSQEGRSART